jgi:hypothetical protein
MEQNSYILFHTIDLYGNQANAYSGPPRNRASHEIITKGADTILRKHQRAKGSLPSRAGHWGRSFPGRKLVIDIRIFLEMGPS